MSTSNRFGRAAILLGFLALFMAAAFAISNHVALDHWEVVLLGLAASFGGSSLAYLTIFEWVRSPFTKVVAHSSGVGECVEPREDKGVLFHVIGQWISCPICSGSWVATGLLLIWSFNPSFGHVLLYLLAAAGIGRVITRLTELLEWKGRHAWEETAQANRMNKEEQKADDVLSKIEKEVDHLIAREKELEEEHVVYGQPWPDPSDQVLASTLLKMMGL